MSAIERSFARNKAIVNTNESEVINSKHELYRYARSQYRIQNRLACGSRQITVRAKRQRSVNFTGESGFAVTKQSEPRRAGAARPTIHILWTLQIQLRFPGPTNGMRSLPAFWAGLWTPSTSLSSSFWSTRWRALPVSPRTPSCGPLTATLAMRPVGAIVFGLLADRYGRRIPLMANVIFFSVVELLCGFAPNYTVFLVLRTIYGIGMGGEWGVGASLAMESAPAKWRGILSGIVQSGYSIGYLLAAVASRFVLPTLGWRGDVLDRRRCRRCSRSISG